MMERVHRLGLSALLLAGLALAQTPTQPTRPPVAVVNGIEISRAELEAAIRAAGPVAVPLTEAQSRQRQSEALAMLIDNLLMRQFLEKNTPPVSAEEVRRRLDEMEAGLNKQQPRRSLEEFCQETNQTLEQLRANVAEHIRWNHYLASRLTDEVLEKYFRENRDFFEGTTVCVSHIAIRLSPQATDAEKARARSHLEKLRQRLLSDPQADFAEMARKESQDPLAKEGGKLGYIPLKWFDERFSRAAFAVPVGQISNVVETDFGLHLIKVTDRKQGQPVDFSRIKDAVREMYSEDLRQQILSDLRKTATITVDLP